MIRGDTWKTLNKQQALVPDLVRDSAWQYAQKCRNFKSCLGRIFYSKKKLFRIWEFAFSVRSSSENQCGNSSLPADMAYYFTLPDVVFPRIGHAWSCLQQQTRLQPMLTPSSITFLHMGRRNWLHAGTWIYFRKRNDFYWCSDFTQEEDVLACRLSFYLPFQYEQCHKI